MILLCGIPTEGPLALAIAALEEIGAEFLVFNQRKFASTEFSFRIVGGAVSGALEYEGRSYPAEAFDGAYIRFMDHRMLPELAKEKPGSALRRHADNLHDALTRWLEIAPLRAVNRMSPMCSNSSKPYQAQLIRRCGLGIPDTLISSDPASIRAFSSEHGRVIYKSTSGVRSVVQTLGDADLARLERVRWCPTQFQQYLPGTDIRVHVVGTEVFATAIESSATDYRYAQAQVGKPAELKPVELSDELSGTCVRLAAELGLAFAGIDLKITPEGETYCFEVNPCPGYSYYENNTGQRISLALARYLAGQQRNAAERTEELVGR
ncbi:glutathione synthase [Opitutaceae bacterium EW11]|nr:glutathione synthase [Opitutaceae bacterium EW11]